MFVCVCMCLFTHEHRYPQRAGAWDPLELELTDSSEQRDMDSGDGIEIQRISKCWDYRIITFLPVTTSNSAFSFLWLLEPHQDAFPRTGCMCGSLLHTSCWLADRKRTSTTQGPGQTPS